MPEPTTLIDELTDRAEVLAGLLRDARNPNDIPLPSEIAAARVFAAYDAGRDAEQTIAIETLEIQTAALEAVTDRMDDHAYDEIASALADRALDPDSGRTYSSRLAATENALHRTREAIDALPSSVKMPWLHERESSDWWGTKPVGAHLLPLTEVDHHLPGSRG